ncbi:MAG: amidohydrolase [Clostridia bacterium]|nr:amidohydrolase [Clostridia bacterium]
MKILFENVKLLSGEQVYVTVDGARFDYVGVERPSGKFDQIKNCRGALLIPAFYNTHCHAAMTLFRGVGDGLPLSRWLNEKIFPAEDKLTWDATYWATLLGCAEMISSGTVSFSDMYMFEDAVADAVIECGVKANLARGLVSFDENADFAQDTRFCEAKELYNRYNGAEDDRIKIEMSLHAEYTNVEAYCAYVADYCRAHDIPIQLHLSETRDEHEKCIAKYGVTPTGFFERAGVLDAAVTAAHCVWVSDEDIELLAQNKVSVSHNPSSNLKLGSGVMPYSKIAASGVLVALGTDGAASNNSLNIMKEMQLAALLHKGMQYDAAAAGAREMLDVATVNGAKVQRREDCVCIAHGYRADAVLIDLNAPNTLPSSDLYATLMYSADRSNVLMTMCDGRILFENGEYKSIDIERVKFNFSRCVSQIFE